MTSSSYVRLRLCRRAEVRETRLARVNNRVLTFGCNPVPRRYKFLSLTSYRQATAVSGYFKSSPTGGSGRLCQTCLYTSLHFRYTWDVSNMSHFSSVSVRRVDLTFERASMSVFMVSRLHCCRYDSVLFNSDDVDRCHTPFGRERICDGAGEMF